MSRYIKLIRFCLPLCLLSVFVVLAGCAELSVKRVDYKAALDMPRDAHPRPVEFRKLRFLLPPGTEVGLESGMGPALLGHYCSWHNYPVSRRVLNRKFEKQYLDQAFEVALESQGYDVTNTVDMDFDTEYEDELARSEYFVSAKVTDVDLDVCARGPKVFLDILSAPFKAIGLGRTSRGQKGKIYAHFEWSVYDAVQRKTVLKVSTEGYSRRAYPNVEGLELLFMDAFEMAAHNLGADRRFYDLIVRGVAPRTISGRLFDRGRLAKPRHFDAGEVVEIKNAALRTDSFVQQSDRLRKAAVTVQKRGHGSGFFITKQGHILTNAHVVGDSHLTRVIIEGARKKGYVAEVLRVHKGRDVALLKLLEPPKPETIVTLPIDVALPAVGSQVYAIGTPRRAKFLKNSVTGGVVSYVLRDELRHGLRLNFIQSDVSVQKGNSGGPLLDGNGNIIGMTVEGEATSEGVSMGLNLFIPIGEALEALDIVLTKSCVSP